MGITWRGGRDIADMQLSIENAGEDFKARALRALELSVEDGAVYTQDNLEAAITPTGEAREERGGFPGRHDSGRMVGATNHEVRSPRSRIPMGVFGWWDADFEAYFRDQDQGEGNIPAARALPMAFYRARENFRRRMREVARGRSVS